MKVASQHKNFNKWIFHLMTFAFFWLVIGDLVTLHQKVIFGFDPYGLETPFTKTDNSSSKTKKIDKGSKFDKFKDQFHADVLLNKEFKVKTILVSCDFEFINTYTVFISPTGLPLLPLRGPPTV